MRKCPFCGGEAQIVKPDYWVMYAVGCDGKYGSNCPGYIWKMTPLYYTREQATRFWNNEHQSDIELDNTEHDPAIDGSLEDWTRGEQE